MKKEIKLIKIEITQQELWQATKSGVYKNKKKWSRQERRKNWKGDQE